MQKFAYVLSLALAVTGVEIFAAEVKPLGKVRCTVTAVDQTPVYFLGPSGEFPAVDSQIDLDLGAQKITEDLNFDPFGRIPLKRINVALEKKAISHGDAEGEVYFDGQFISPSKATYTLAIHVDAQGVGELQIARRAFYPKLELYNAALKCR